MTNISLVNNIFTDQISVYDRGLSYGDGFFETMFWKNAPNTSTNKVEFWDRHIMRIKDSCNLLNIKFPQEEMLFKYKEKILSKAQENKYKSGVLKIIITRGVGGRGYKYEENMTPTIIFQVSPKPSLSKIIYKNGVDVIFCKKSITRNENLSGYKHLNRLDSVLSRSEWNDPKIFEGIFLDKRENIIEGTMTNIFMLKKNTIYTPSINDSGIKGIMRQIVIEKCKNFFDEIVIDKIPKKEFLSSDSIFLTNSILKILPIRKIENLEFKINKKIKEIMADLQDDKNLELK